MEYYRQPPSDTLHALDSTPDGLTPAQAAARLARDGRNVLTEPPKPSLVKRFFQQLADPMILVLLAAALISAITSAYAHESFADVIIILIVVIINAVLGVYQESKAEQAIAALKELSAAHSRVLRGGKLVTVPSEKLVVGDVLVLEAGDAVPADARVLESASLRAEEAALTGESVPVTKSPDALTAAGHRSRRPQQHALSRQQHRLRTRPRRRHRDRHADADGPHRRRAHADKGE